MSSTRKEAAGGLLVVHADTNDISDRDDGNLSGSNISATNSENNLATTSGSKKDGDGNTTDEKAKPRRRRRSNAQLQRDILCPFSRCDKCYASKHALQLHVRNKHMSSKNGQELRLDEMDPDSMMGGMGYAMDNRGLMFSSSQEFDSGYRQRKYMAQGNSPYPLSSASMLPYTGNGSLSSISQQSLGRGGIRRGGSLSSNMSSVSVDSFSRNGNQYQGNASSASFSDDQIMSLLSDILSKPASGSGRNGNTLLAPSSSNTLGNPMGDEDMGVTEDFLDDILLHASIRLDGQATPNLPNNSSNGTLFNTASQPQLQQGSRPIQGSYVANSGQQTQAQTPSRQMNSHPNMRVFVNTPQIPGLNVDGGAIATRPSLQSLPSQSMDGINFGFNSGAGGGGSINNPQANNAQVQYRSPMTSMSADDLHRNNSLPNLQDMYLGDGSRTQHTALSSQHSTSSIGSVPYGSKQPTQRQAPSHKGQPRLAFVPESTALQHHHAPQQAYVNGLNRTPSGQRAHAIQMQQQQRQQQVSQAQAQAQAQLNQHHQQQLNTQQQLTTQLHPQIQQQQQQSWTSTDPVCVPGRPNIPVFNKMSAISNPMA